MFLSAWTDHSLEHPELADACWNDVEHYASVPELGAAGYVKFANNGTHMLELFVVDASLEWVSLEMNAGTEDCMVSDNDGLTMYIDDSNQKIDLYDETFYGASGMPTHDQQNDLTYRYGFEEGMVTIELTRLLNSTDPLDLNFADGDLINLKFASSDMHFGSHEIYFLSVQTSGGPVIIPDVPQVVDYSQWKPRILVGGMILVGAFILTHIAVRQVFKPLHHRNSIVDSTFKRPTLKSRWADLTRGSKRRDLSLLYKQEVKV